MIGAYDKLFGDLNDNRINYILYKGLNHIEADLNGERGDIDLLVDDIKYFEQIILKNRWVRILKDNYPKYYFKLYNQSNLMLDIENKIRLGEKPYRPYYFSINITKLKTTKFKNITILANEDYIPLMFIMRVTAKSDKKENLEELQNLIKKVKVEGHIKDIVEKYTKTKWNEIQKDILNATSWSELKIKYKDNILQNVKVDGKFLLAQKFQWIINKYKAIQRKIFKNPPYRIRKKGYLVAFMGNDGAGKSSTIEAILNVDYFKYTGIKMIYFGNNQYVIPFLNYFMKKIYKNKIINIGLGLIGSIDKKVRTIIAKYYINRGCIVFADRYVYDELMALEYNKSNKTNNILKRIYRVIIKPRMVIKPEITFFLDVDPEVAYSRKQDYDFEAVKLNIKRYREFLSKFDEVIKVDANQPQNKVIEEVIKRIYEKDLEINKKY